MMNKKRTSRIGLLKYALLLPVTGMLILSANAGPLVEMAETTLKEWKMVPDPVMQQKNKVMTGRILDEKGTPLPGATIMVKEKSIGTVSDAEGKFRLEVNEPGTLYFSYVGRKTEMKSFDMTTGELQIELKKDQLFLDKIVVTAYNGKQEEKGEALVVVEEMPEFPFGNVLKYLAKTVKYPTIACENGIEGTVFVSFVVNSQGKVTDAKVVKGVDASLDKEALRVINAMPDWKPGKQRGKPVDVQYTMPIEFSIFKPSTKKIQMNKLPADSLVVSKDKHEVIIAGTGQPQGKVERKSHEELRDLVRWEGDKKPVYIIDGKRFADLAELNVDDVERISVLLPPSAVKIYGEIAKNGAMVIETKKK